MTQRAKADASRRVRGVYAMFAALGGDEAELRRDLNWSQVIVVIVVVTLSVPDDGYVFAAIAHKVLIVEGQWDIAVWYRVCYAPHLGPLILWVVATVTFCFAIM
jgi:hypothetical protein